MEHERRAIRFTLADCSLGRLIVAGSETGLCWIRFGSDDGALETDLRGEFPWARVERDEVAVKVWCDRVISYIDGTSDRLDVPMDVRGSRFQRRVWQALRAIPRGATRSYREVAAAVGSPRGARAVARACAANPLAVVIPCHRVVPRRGGIGGYGGGVERKRALLEREARS